MYAGNTNRLPKSKKQKPKQLGAPTPRSTSLMRDPLRHEGILFCSMSAANTSLKLDTIISQLSNP